MNARPSIFSARRPAAGARSQKPFADVALVIGEGGGEVGDWLGETVTKLRPGGKILLSISDRRAIWALKARMEGFGLVDWQAHLYWSEEFGYLGSNNFLLAASFR